MKSLLERHGLAWAAVRELVDRHELREIEYRGARYYLRKLA